MKTTWRLRTVTAMATPPRRAVGRPCHRSARGVATHPKRLAAVRHSGTSAADRPKATRRYCNHRHHPIDSLMVRPEGARNRTSPAQLSSRVRTGIVMPSGDGRLTVVGNSVRCGATRPLRRCVGRVLSSLRNPRGRWLRSRSSMRSGDRAERSCSERPALQKCRPLGKANAQLP